MNPIRIGIIGVGQIGKIHLDQYKLIPDAEIVAVCDVNEAEARRVADLYEIPEVYTDYNELLKRDDLDAVDVCLHNNFHAPISIAAMKAGKHVYCEKPIAGTYADGKAMVDASREFGRLLHIQLGTLYRKETKAAKALIEGGELGRVFHARSTGYRRRNRPFVDGYGTPAFTRKETAAGGALFDMGVYHISQMLYLLDLPKVERISGKLYQETDMDPGRRESSGFDVEELAIGLVRFENGITMDIIESWAVHMNPFEGSSVLGSKGGLRLPVNGPDGNKLTHYSTRCDMDMDTTIDLDAADLRWHRLRADEEAYDSSQHHWIAALQGRVKLLPTAEIALQTMLISEGMYLSDAQGREVSAEEVENGLKA
ncbi:Gfo/Idh/MocA family protein [Paenibacillus chitinolyticus]|uniref:Gfo/Idh/MocA family protein n=1 Tax=Paenibacillus chitinolyticus TaxID=79263 RepID=UPI001C464109|nr:Gfo/Idh/MocA family oxidoreductase [Paenibacillus chitinolyticus]MBV6714043.1 Gfo/Idh/MocA family oxidoreductase [Paenibacillus chitinolyticus]